MCLTEARPQAVCMAAKLEALSESIQTHQPPMLQAVCCSSAGRLAQVQCLSGQSGYEFLKICHIRQPRPFSHHLQAGRLHHSPCPKPWACCVTGESAAAVARSVHSGLL